MNARVKGMAFSVLTAMFILALTAGTASAECGGFQQAGYVRYGNGTEIDFDNFNMTITNLNTSTVWYKGDGISTWSGYGYYKLVTTSPVAPPFDDRTCAWITGDVAEYKVWSLDGTYTNTTYHTMTGTDMLYAKYNMDIYVKAAGEETFSKDLVEGWNLVSLPLEPWDNNTSAVLSSMSGKYDAVYSYDAVTNEFKDVMTGTMDPGTGYFVHVTSAGTWTYAGSAYTDMDGISLQPGLNMVGWLNCSRPIYDALSSIDGDYWYVARWNATAQEFETYNPVAPNGFNDFADMERGEGYYISMKGAGTLTASC
ncbi:hypothetical protein CW713_03740 [Methanophagales archaeon]|nr:MAG: hypothetical protein CW713_03740 [Methanophagales archaeon]